MVELSAWDENHGADLRWVRAYKHPYRITEDGVQHNPLFAEGLLMRKPDTKSTYFIMGDDERWSKETLYVAALEECTPYFMGLEELIYSDDFKTLPMEVQCNIRANYERDLQEQRNLRK